MANDTKLSLRARIALSLLRAAGVKNMTLAQSSLRKGEAEYWKALKARQERARTPVFPSLLNPAVIDVDGYSLIRIQGGARNDKPDKACLFIHGGGFVEPPSILHRLAAVNLAKTTNAAVYFAQYPLVPDADIFRIFAHIKKAYLAAAQDFGKPLTAVIGDSAGGTLVLYLASSLDAVDHPGRFIPISACCDSTLANPAIDAFDREDPMLSIEVLRILAKRLLASAAGEDISPLRLPYENLKRSGARLDLFIGGKDILYPDNILLHERLLREGLTHGFYVEPEMFHIYPLAPFIPECRRAFLQICGMVTETA
jgi:acetyl esterase/lipase